MDDEGVGRVTRGADPDEMPRSAVSHWVYTVCLGIVRICPRYSGTSTPYHIYSKICISTFCCQVLCLKVLGE